MANAKVVKKVVETQTFVLELSEDEALAVKALTGCVSGCSAQRDASNAVHNSISNALFEAGVDAATHKYNHRFYLLGPIAVRFRNPEPNSEGHV